MARRRLESPGPCQNLPALPRPPETLQGPGPFRAFIPVRKPSRAPILRRFQNLRSALDTMETLIGGNASCC